MTNRFEHILREILAVELGQAAGPELLDELHTLLEENRLDQAANVPGWLLQFFSALQRRQALPYTPQPDEETDADVGEFFACLENLAPFDCLDYGEWMRVRLARHGMLGFISRTQGAYLVTPLDQVPDDRVSDLSQAKLLER